jgi:IS66 Orf2 like protein
MSSMNWLTLGRNRWLTLTGIQIYDTGGLVLLSKRLEKGTFEMVKTESKEIKLSINWTQLTCIMQGIKLRSIRYRKRHKIVEK